MSSIMSHHEIFEEPPSSTFVASIIDFLLQVIMMDTVSYHNVLVDGRATTAPAIFENKPISIPTLLRKSYGF